MKLVIIESPYAGNRNANIEYAKACLLDSIRRSEAPIAFHLLYPLVMEDSDAAERALALDMSFRWYKCASLIAVYTDMGVSPGMLRGIETGHKFGLEVEHRRLPSW